MGFQITALTSIPTDPAGTHDSPTWGESGGPYSVPAKEDAGYGAETLPSNDVNYTRQHWARWTRAMRDRLAFSDEGFLTTCVLSQGTWNTGGGTLDVTLTPTRLVVDVDSDGGTVIEVIAPVGSPETLAANSDTYIGFDEAGNYSKQAVPAGDPAPVVTPGYVHVFKLTTDATELTGTGLTSGVAPFPCLGPTVGALNLNVTTLAVGGNATVSGTLDVTGLVTLSDDLEVAGEVNVTNILSANELNSGGTLGVTGNATIGGTLGVTSDATVGGTFGVTGATTLSGALEVNNTTQLNGTVTLPTGESFEMQGTSQISGGASTNISAGSFEFETGAAAPATERIARDSLGRLIYNNSGTLEQVHKTANGYVYATGESPSTTGLAASRDIAQTSVATKGAGLGVVRVIVSGEIQVASLGSTFTLEIQEDQTANPVFTTVGTSLVKTAKADTSDANDWQSFRIERTFNCGTSTATHYRIRVTSQGAVSHRTREVYLRVVNER